MVQAGSADVEEKEIYGELSLVTVEKKSSQVEWI